MKTLMILLCLLNSTITLGGTIDPGTPDSKYIEYGKKHRCVIRVLCSSDKGTAFGSGVLVKPRWIVTAAHVVNKSKGIKIVLDNKKEIASDATFIPKEWTSEKFGYYDLALCRLEEDANLDFYPDLYENKDEEGKICSLSGFGVTGKFSSSDRIDDGIKRAGSNKIDNIDRHLLICSPSLSDKTALEFLISHGDSGGGLFIDKKLAGIHSGVIASDKNPNSSYGDESGHTRISIHKDWIYNTIKENSELHK